MNQTGANTLFGVAEPENLRIRVPPDLKRRFESVVDDKGGSQQKAIVKLIAWFVDQPELLQGLILAPIQDEHMRQQVATLALMLIQDPKAKVPFDFRRFADERDSRQAGPLGIKSRSR